MQATSQTGGAATRPRACCMVVHSYYPDDPRVRREAEALANDGWGVDVVCLRGAGQAAREVLDGVSVHRLPVRRHRGRSLAVYLLEYLAFFTLAFWRVTWLGLRRRYAVVQTHNMPDFLVFAGLVPRLLGARVVHDMHDLVPELFATKYGGNDFHPVVRLLRLVEGASTSFAAHVLTVGEALRWRLVATGVPPDKVTVVMNAADSRLFAPRPSPEQGEHFRLVYHGSLFERCGVDVAIRAVALLRGDIPTLSFDIYGEGEFAPCLSGLVSSLGLEGTVHLAGAVPLERLPAAVASADLGVVPYRKNEFTDYIYPTKAFECIALGVPVVVSRTKAIFGLLGAVPDMFFQPGDPADLAGLIRALYRDPARRRELASAAWRAYAPYRWEEQRERYLSLMNHLAGQETTTVAGVGRAKDRQAV